MVSVREGPIIVAILVDRFNDGELFGFPFVLSSSKQESCFAGSFMVRPARLELVERLTTNAFLRRDHHRVGSLPLSGEGVECTTYVSVQGISLGSRFHNLLCDGACGTELATVASGEILQGR